MKRNNFSQEEFRLKIVLNDGVWDAMNDYDLEMVTAFEAALNENLYEKYLKFCQVAENREAVNMKIKGDTATDTDIMPFGKYKGQMIGNVPDDYLLWLYGELNKKCSPSAKPLKNYLDDNIEAIKANIEASKPFCND